VLPLGGVVDLVYNDDAVLLLGTLKFVVCAGFEVVDNVSLSDVMLF